MSFWDTVFGKTTKEKGTVDQTSRQEQARPEFERAPEYGETEQARKSWWDAVQSFGEMPGYGAIAPDWADIWERARQKVDQYIYGTATRPGALNAVSASAARRNVSDSPALEASKASLFGEGGLAIGNLARDQAIAEAQFAESGRQSWLDQLRMLTSLQMPGQWWTPWQTEAANKQYQSKMIQTDSPWDNMMKVASAFGSLYSSMGGKLPQLPQ